MTDQQHAEMTQRLATTKEREPEIRDRQQVGRANCPGPYSGTVLPSARDTIRSEINRLTGRIEQLKQLDRILPLEMPALADEAIANLVRGSAR